VTQRHGKEAVARHQHPEPHDAGAIEGHIQTEVGSEEQHDAVTEDDRHFAVRVHRGYHPRHNSGRADDARKPPEPERMRPAAQAVESDVKRNERYPGQEPDIVFWKAVWEQNAGGCGKKDQTDGPLTHRANLAEGEGMCNLTRFDSRC
jgi:hypothetical protein